MLKRLLMTSHNLFPYVYITFISPKLKTFTITRKLKARSMLVFLLSVCTFRMSPEFQFWNTRILGWSWRAHKWRWNRALTWEECSFGAHSSPSSSVSLLRLMFKIHLPKEELQSCWGWGKVWYCLFTRNNLFVSHLSPGIQLLSSLQSHGCLLFANEMTDGWWSPVEWLVSRKKGMTRG